jgi:hypothetical protein
MWGVFQGKVLPITYAENTRGLARHQEMVYIYAHVLHSLALDVRLAGETVRTGCGDFSLIRSLLRCL